MKRAFVLALILSAAVLAFWKASPALARMEQERCCEDLAFLKRAAGPDSVADRLRRVELRIS